MPAKGTAASAAQAGMKACLRRKKAEQMPPKQHKKSITCCFPDHAGHTLVFLMWRKSVGIIATVAVVHQKKRTSPK
jgi:hypothetical protein